MALAMAALAITVQGATAQDVSRRQSSRFADLVAAIDRMLSVW
jgi:hypothetical protein